MLHRHATPAVAGGFTLGNVCGALASASALLVIGGLLSPISPEVRGVVAICCIIVVVFHAVGFVCLDLPQHRYQITRETFAVSKPRAAFRFAAELGTGVRTYVTMPAPYALVVALALCLPTSLGAAVVAAAATGIGFGLGRARIVAAQSWRRTVAVEHPKHWLTAASYVSIALSLAIAVDFFLAS